MWFLFQQVLNDLKPDWSDFCGCNQFNAKNHHPMKTSHWFSILFYHESLTGAGSSIFEPDSDWTCFCGWNQCNKTIIQWKPHMGFPFCFTVNHTSHYQIQSVGRQYQLSHPNWKVPISFNVESFNFAVSPKLEKMLCWSNQTWTCSMFRPIQSKFYMASYCFLFESFRPTLPKHLNFITIKHDPIDFFGWIFSTGSFQTSQSKLKIWLIRRSHLFLWLDLFDRPLPNIPTQSKFTMLLKELYNMVSSEPTLKMRIPILPLNCSFGLLVEPFRPAPPKHPNPIKIQNAQLKFNMVESFRPYQHWKWLSLFTLNFFGWIFSAGSSQTSQSNQNWKFDWFVDPIDFLVERFRPASPKHPNPIKI